MRNMTSFLKSDQNDHLNITVGSHHIRSTLGQNNSSMISVQLSNMKPSSMVEASAARSGLLKDIASRKSYNEGNAVYGDDDGEDQDKQLS